VATLEGFINNYSNSNDQELIELREENKKLRTYLRRAEETISNLIDLLTKTEERNNALTTYSRSVDSLLQKLEENVDYYLVLH